MSSRRQWSELPQDLLHLLMKRMIATSLQEMIRCALVCRSWRAVLLAAASTYECQTTSPFLLIQEKGSPSSLTLFSPSDERCYKLDHHLVSPGSLSYMCTVGFSHCWLAAYDSQDPNKIVFLINVLTGAQVSLPPLSSVVPPLEEDWDPGEFQKIVWSSCPTSSSCTAMAIFDDCNSLAFAKPGDGSWQLVTVPWERFNYMAQIVHCNNLFYVIDSCGLVAVCDVHSQPPQVVEVALLPDERLLFPEENYLNVDIYMGDMLGKLMAVIIPRDIFILDPHPYDVKKDMEFKIFEIRGRGEGGYEVMHVRGLEGGNLFLSDISSCGVSTPHNAGLKCANCIYLCESMNSFQTPLIRYCLDDGRVRSLAGNIDYRNMLWAEWVELSIAQLFMKLFK